MKEHRSDHELDVPSSELWEETLVIPGQERISVRTVVKKIRLEIAFLRDRVSRMSEFQNPNIATMDTYQKMLESRESVLNWLEEHYRARSKHREAKAVD